MKELGFYLIKEDTRRKYYKKEIDFTKTNKSNKAFLGIKKEVYLIIQNKSNNNFFLKKILYYTNGKTKQEPFCLTKELLQALTDLK